MRRLVYFSTLLLVLLLSCSLFSSLLEPPNSASTTIPALVSPVYPLSPIMTEELLPSFTPAENSQPPSNTPSQSSTPSPNATSSPTLTPFPTILPMTCLPSRESSEFGQVKRVQDGDTILVEIQGHLTVVRYLGIRSPENLPNIQYMGPPAATQNAALVQGQIVQLIPDAVQRNQNGQIFRYVLIYNTDTFVNFEMLRLGLAQTDPNSSALGCNDTFNLIQEQARIAEKGLWAPTSTLFPSATLRPTRTATLTRTSLPTSAFSPTPGASYTTTVFTPTPSSTMGAQTSTPSTASPSPSGTPPTATGSPTPTPTGVQIVNIFYRGTGTNESDEFVEIKNFGSSPANLFDWWILSDSKNVFFTFSQVTLGPGQSCRVYTDQTSGTYWCGDFESSDPIWDNTSDCGELNDANDELVSSFCYP